MVAYTKEELDGFTDEDMKGILEKLTKEIEMVRLLEKEQNVSLSYSFYCLAETIAALKRELHKRETDRCTGLL